MVFLATASLPEYSSLTKGWAWDGTLPAGGRSPVAPLLRGQASQGIRKSTDRVPPAGRRGPPACKADRTATHKYRRYITKENKLYGLNHPDELESIPEKADRSLVASVRVRLDALRFCVGQPCRKA